MTTPDHPIDALGKQLFAMTRSQALARGVCIQCKKPALARCYSAAGRADYPITSMCEICFDALHEGMDD